MLPTVEQMEAYIRQKAVEMGIDPEIAVRVARSEGLRPDTWQSNVQQPYGREASYGPYQLHVDPTGKRPGMGNDFMKATGLDPADPATWKTGVDYALGRAKEGGWSPWFGAKKIGITGKMGIGEAPPAAAQTAGTSMGGYAMGPEAVQDRMDTGEVMGLLDDPTSWLGDIDTEAMGEFGMEFLKKAKAEQDAMYNTPAPQAQVLQPLNRVNLKGLLG